MIQFLMIKIFKIELLYFFAILLVLTFIQHPDLLSSPFARVTLMQKNENYFHPLLWTLFVYTVVGIFRFMYKLIRAVKNKLVK